MPDSEATLVNLTARTTAKGEHAIAVGRPGPRALLLEDREASAGLQHKSAAFTVTVGANRRLHGGAVILLDARLSRRDSARYVHLDWVSRRTTGTNSDRGTGDVCELKSLPRQETFGPDNPFQSAPWPRLILGIARYGASRGNAVLQRVGPCTVWPLEDAALEPDVGWHRRFGFRRRAHKHARTNHCGAQSKSRALRNGMGM